MYVFVLWKKERQKGLRVSQQPGVYLEPKWLRCHLENAKQDSILLARGNQLAEITSGRWKSGDSWA